MKPKIDVSKPTGFYQILKWFAVAIVSILLLLAILVAALPMISNMAIVYWLEQQGIIASVESIEIDVNDARLTVLNAQGENQQGQGFRLGRFNIDLAWRPLLDHVVQIDMIEISGLALDSAQNLQGLQTVAGIHLTTPAEPQAETPVKQPVSTPWRIVLGDVRLHELNLCHEYSDQAKQFCLQLEDFDWTGKLSVDLHKPAAEQLEMLGGLRFAGVSVEDKKQQRLLLTGREIILSNLALESMDDVVVEMIRLEGWMLFPGLTATGAQHIAQLDGLQLNDVVYKNRQLQLKQVTIKGLGANVQRNKQGQWEINQLLESIALQSTASVQEPVERKSAEAMQFKIDAVHFIESHPVAFVDETLKTPFELAAQIKVFSLQKIDTGNPDQRSAIQLHIVTDKHGSIELDGDVQLLAKARSMDINGKIMGFDLRPVGSYIESGLGHRIKSGQLNAQIKLQADKGKLNSVLNLDLKQFQLKESVRKEQETSDEEAEGQAAGLPLDTALNLLRDKDNSIKLEIPVTGDVNNPEFDPSDAIYKATSSAITTAVINYYTPFGLVTAVGGLIDLATALRFEPVVFAPATIELSSDQLAYLDDISRLMTERPELHLSLCGFANREDVEVMNPERLEQLTEAPLKPDEELMIRLLAMAAERAEMVKVYLVSKGIAADRLILCEGEFDVEKISGVEMSI